MGSASTGQRDSFKRFAGDVETGGVRLEKKSILFIFLYFLSTSEMWVGRGKILAGFSECIFPTVETWCRPYQHAPPHHRLIGVDEAIAIAYALGMGQIKPPIKKKFFFPYFFFIELCFSLSERPPSSDVIWEENPIICLLGFAIFRLACVYRPQLFSISIKYIFIVSSFLNYMCFISVHIIV